MRLTISPVNVQPGDRCEHPKTCKTVVIVSRRYLSVIGTHIFECKDLNGSPAPSFSALRGTTMRIERSFDQ